MTMRNGDGTDEKPEVEKIELPSDEPNSKVDLDAAEDEPADDEDEQEQAAKGEERPRRKNGTWAAKKKERGEERKAASTWKAEKDEYDRRFKQLREETDRSVRQMREELDRVRASNGTQQRNPIDGKLDDIGKQIERELSLIENDANRGYAEYNKLRREEQRLISTQVMMEHAAEQQRQQQSQPRDQYAARRPIIESEYPWIADDQYRELAQRARAYREYLIQVERKPDTIDTDREALSHVQAHFGSEYGLRPPPAPPTQRTRGLYAPPPSRGTPQRGPERREVDLGPLAQGHGLSAQALARAVRDGIGEN